MNRFEDRDILERTAQLLDLPVDVVAGFPNLELLGDRQLFLTRHRGILSYSDTAIDVNCGELLVRVRGRGAVQVWGCGAVQVRCRCGGAVWGAGVGVRGDAGVRVRGCGVGCGCGCGAAQGRRSLPGGGEQGTPRKKRPLLSPGSARQGAALPRPPAVRRDAGKGGGGGCAKPHKKRDGAGKAPVPPAR